MIRAKGRLEPDRARYRPVEPLQLQVRPQATYLLVHDRKAGVKLMTLL